MYVCSIFGEAILTALNITRETKLSDIIIVY